MSEVVSLSAESRDRAGKGGARATRRDGLVPAVIYGNKQAPVSIAVDPKVLWAQMNTPGLRSRLFDISVNGTVERALCRDIQKHKVSGQPLHVDFLRVSGDAKVHVKITVHFSNQDKSPGLKRGGVLNIVAHDLEIIAAADHIPSELLVDLEGLDIGASVHVNDLKLPKGVTVVTHGENATIATIASPTVSANVEAAAAETTGEAAS
ncbi:MAG TPA: 50S ribosomal protein L25/general stress protein Ctc [Magnetospirillaceae bacterium]|nr:50S ribosomal protein L25/general stress protein Ctc [Magnetospirillaceae bacterium]